jgi:2'-5' RNA ligase
MPSTIRTFIAVEISDAIRAELENIQRELMKTAAHVSWVKPQNIHCTFVFLGDIFSEMIAQLTAILDRHAAGLKPFEVEVATLGFFGSPRSPRIVWAGMTGGTEILIKLQESLAADVAKMGIKLDAKPFKPHLTIGRVRSNRNAQALISAIETNKEKSFGKHMVQRIVLMQSVLSAQGPEYSLLHASAFRVN